MTAKSYIRTVQTILKESGQPEATKWFLGLQEDSRKIVNERLRLVVARSPENSFNIRFCICDDGTDEDWEEALRETVIPFAIKNKVFE